MKPPMKLFIDTADIAAIQDLVPTGMVDGVTTNPSLILKSGRNIAEVTREICELVEGPVSAEVVAAEVADRRVHGGVVDVTEQRRDRLGVGPVAGDGA